MVNTLEKTILQTNILRLEGITWEKFEELEIAFQNIEGVRFTYLDGELEIVMSPSQAHESFKSLIGNLLENYMIHKGIRFYMWGSTTLGKKEITGRKEPDESYSLYAKKDIPDLIIEVIITSGSIEILEIYRRLGIPEVWFWEDGLLTVYALQDQQYQKVNQSQLLPELNLEILAKYVNYHDQFDAINEFTNYLKQS
jgi:Uma2 family endonuclease